jgi:hypothetical protein
MDDDLIELAMDVQTAPSQLEKAKAEKRFMEAIPKGTWAWEERITKLIDMSGGVFKHIQLRQRLLNASPYSDYLWPMIESGKLSLNAAVTELRAYEINNGLVKPKSISTAKTIKPPPSIVETVIPEPISITESQLPSDPNNSTPKKVKPVKSKKRHRFPIMSQVTSLVEKVRKGLKKANPSLSDDEINSLTEEFKRDIENLVGVLKTRASRKVRINEAMTEGTIYKEIMSVNKSCELLGMNKPKKGRLVDLKIAKTKMKAKVLQCHPDKNPDNEEAPKHFRELVEALEILKSYNEKLEQSDA